MYVLFGLIAITTVVLGIWWHNHRRDQKTVTWSLLAAGAVATVVCLNGTPQAAPATATAATSYPYVSAPVARTPIAMAPAAEPTVVYPLTTIGSGTYLVPNEVAPGSYVTEGAPWCYWARLKDTEGNTIGSINANGNVTGHTTVTIKATDKAFEVNGSCVFTKR